MRAAGRRARLACLPVCSSHLMSMAAMLHRPADLRATCKQNARHELCAKAGGTATAGTRHAASTLAARLAPRHPRQACRPTYDSLHACVPRQLKAEPSEAAALAQPRLITRPRQQLGSPTRRSERSRPSSWSGGQRVVARAAWTSCLGVQQCTACFGVHRLHGVHRLLRSAPPPSECTAARLKTATEN